MAVMLIITGSCLSVFASLVRNIIQKLRGVFLNYNVNSEEKIRLLIKYTYGYINPEKNCPAE